MTSQPKTATPSEAERHGILIRKAISEARAAGVNVDLIWEETYDGVSVKLTTVEYEEVDGLMQVKSAWIVEGY